MSKLFSTVHALCKNNVYQDSCLVTWTRIVHIVVSISSNSTNSTRVMPWLKMHLPCCCMPLSSYTCCLLVQYFVSCSYGTSYPTFKCGCRCGTTAEQALLHQAATLRHGAGSLKLSFLHILHFSKQVGADTLQHTPCFQEHAVQVG